MLLVKPVNQENPQVTASGIYLPEMQKKNNLTVGEVVRVGTDYMNAEGNWIESEFNEGDFVAFKLHNMIDEVKEVLEGNAATLYLVPSAEVVARVVL